MLSLIALILSVGLRAKSVICRKAGITAERYFSFSLYVYFLNSTLNVAQAKEFKGSAYLEEDIYFAKDIF